MTESAGQTAIDGDSLATLARGLAPACSHWSVRVVHERDERIQVRNDLCEPVQRGDDQGLMVSVSDRGGLAHVAVSCSDPPSLAAAFERARDQARAQAAAMLALPREARPGWQLRPARHYRGPQGDPLPAALSERIERVSDACRSLAVDPRIVERRASVHFSTVSSRYVDGDGTDMLQEFRYIVPNLTAIAGQDGVSQTRTLGGQYNGFCRQGGFEVLHQSGFVTEGPRVGAEAVELLLAAPCPAGRMDLLLMPDQMMLQIHESIGHPLELDRILGDERNFAGTSFVTPDLFGHYRYGSELLNVSHDPGDPTQFASFALDDEGTASARVRLIENGILLQPLGGATSMARIGRGAAESRGWPVTAESWQAVATTRASGWNRAPIDRMSNLNLEPGDSTLAQMIEATRLGVLMRTNCSWSIDDSRNKFQFGCEHGQMIRDGRLAEVVRNPGYRGISATFWRSLAMVGDAGTRAVLGTPLCGKGEPGQVIRVGHASPACRFIDVDVFGSS